MATTAERLREPDMLRSYLHALARNGGTGREELGHGRQRRVCTHCGERAVFTPDTDGWYRCSHCGRYA
ncbi:MAG TPA: hypothetical protein VF097_08470 [Actinomycetota bacterium]